MSFTRPTRSAGTAANGVSIPTTYAATVVGANGEQYRVVVKPTPTAAGLKPDQMLTAELPGYIRQPAPVTVIGSKGYYEKTTDAVSEELDARAYASSLGIPGVLPSAFNKP